MANMGKHKNNDETVMATCGNSRQTDLLIGVSDEEGVGAASGSGVGPFPWAAVQGHVPKGYSLTAKGVFRERDEPEFISGPCWVSAMTRSHQSQEWGYVVHWIDQDGKERSAAFSGRKFHVTGSPLVGDLVSLGLKVVPGKERSLLQYLGSFVLPPTFRQRSVVRLGWQEGPEAWPLFVMPEQIVGEAGGEKVVFQPEEYSPSVRGLHGNGSLVEWNHQVVGPCAGNPILIFSLCAGFAGPLLKPAGLDSGGFHFYGASSKGKTTALQVGASVWGSGADPAASDASYISRWNTTGNALEAIAAAHNDILLPLDEMGTFGGRDFGKSVYDLFGGQGKSRLNKNSTLQAQRTWRVFGLSTGEISVRQKIEEEPGRKSKAGQLVRLADVPIAQGVITDTHGESPDVFVNRLKLACATCFGTAGPAFMEALMAKFPTEAELQAYVAAEVAAWETDLALGKVLQSHQKRVIRRLALVGAAGALAVCLGVVGIPESEVRRSVEFVRDAWLSDESNKPEGVRAVEAIKATILRDRARFRPLDDEERIVRDLLGYEDGKAGRFLFTDQGFAEACQGLSSELALEELQRRGLLFTNEAGRKKAKQNVLGVGRIRVFVVRAEILEMDTASA